MSKVFGEGTDYYPNNMRHGLTMEEIISEGERLREIMLKRQASEKF